MGSIRKLKEEQKDVRLKRQQISKDFRNAEKKRSRLRKKARQLTDSDLCALLKMRADGKSADEPMGSTSSASASTGPSGPVGDDQSED